MFIVLVLNNWTNSLETKTEISETKIMIKKKTLFKEQYCNKNIAYGPNFDI